MKKVLTGIFLLLYLFSVVQEIPTPIPATIYSETESIAQAGADLENVCLSAPGSATKNVQTAAQKIVRRGIPAEAFENITVYIVPTEVFPEGTKDIGCDAVGFAVSKRGEIWLAGRSENIEGTFAHEFGHILADRLFGSVGYDWSEVSLSGWHYMRLKGYPVENGLHWTFQQEMKWKDRIAEWFAEDFEFYIFRDEKYHTAGPKPTKEIMQFFDMLWQEFPAFSRTHTVGRRRGRECS
jgi:hypothetical protein